MKRNSKQAESCRDLKIEDAGDPYRGGIRLNGQWLRRAGFNPGGRAKVAIVRHGILQITATDTGAESRSQIPPGNDTESAQVSLGNPDLDLVFTNHLICERGGSQ